MESEPYTEKMPIRLAYAHTNARPSYSAGEPFLNEKKGIRFVVNRAPRFLSVCHPHLCPHPKYKHKGLGRSCRSAGGSFRHFNADRKRLQSEL